MVWETEYFKKQTFFNCKITSSRVLITDFHTTIIFAIHCFGVCSLYKIEIGLFRPKVSQLLTDNEIIFFLNLNYYSCDKLSIVIVPK